MIDFRGAYGRAASHVRHHYRQASNVLSHVDRGIGTAWRLYRTLAPLLAPHARRALGDRAESIHDRLGEAGRFYGSQRARVVAADHMARAIAGAVHKEIKGV